MWLCIRVITAARSPQKSARMAVSPRLRTLYMLYDRVSSHSVPSRRHVNTHIDSVLTVVILFLLGLVSPGPNFLVVVQSTLTSGRLAGFVTGLGAATGDALYAACGLFGVAKLIETSGRLMMTIRFLGGLYLIWTG